MIPKHVVMAVLDRDGFRCMIGGPHCQDLASCADHRWDRGPGGNRRANSMVNLVAACGVCNGEKESDPELREECRRRGIALETRTGGHSLSKTAVTDHMLDLLAQTPVVDPDGVAWWLTWDGQRLTGDEWAEWVQEKQAEVMF